MTGLEVRRFRVYERDGGACIAGPVDCSPGLTLQHRLNRGMGGSELRDGYENLTTLCGLHNARLEQDAAFASLGRRLGWKLGAGEDPFVVALFSALWGGWRLLDGAGGWSWASARDREERDRLAEDRYAEWRMQ